MTGVTWGVGLATCVFIGSVFSSARAQQSEADTKYLCVKGDDSRQVEVVTESGYACRVKYTKAAGSSYPWNARNEANYCKPKARGLVEKLKSFGWACESAAVVQPILLEQIERYGRYIKILANVGKTCYFYPSEAQYGNLCGDARDEAALVYTCDGADGDWEQHLAVFLDTETDPLIREVGRSGEHQVSAYYFDDERLLMELEQQTAADEGGEKKSASIRCQYEDYEWQLIESD